MHHLRTTRMGRAEAPSPQRAAVEAVHKFCDQTLNLVAKLFNQGKSRRRLASTSHLNTL
jgi:hypothetical protein